MPVISAVHEPV